MKLLKIGQVYINLDQVVAFDTRHMNGSVQVMFTETTAGTMAVQGVSSFSGAEADALKRWLDMQAEDVLQPAARQ